MNIFSIKIFLRHFSNLLKVFRNHQLGFYNSLQGYKNILLWIIPSILTSIFWIFSCFVNIPLKSIVNNILVITPSLTGFLIASLTILITLNTKTLKEKIPTTNISYRKAGVSLFAYASLTALLLIILSFAMPSTVPSSLLFISSYLVGFTKCLFVFIFSRLLILITYGLLFLSSAVGDE